MWRSGLRNRQRHFESTAGRSRGRSLGCESWHTNTPDMLIVFSAHWKICILHWKIMIGYHGYHDYHVNDQDDDLSLVAGYVRCPDVAVADLLQVLIFQDHVFVIHYPLFWSLARSMVIGKMKWVVKRSNPTKKTQTWWTPVERWEAGSAPSMFTDRKR